MKADELKEIFDQLKPLLKNYEKGSISARMDFESRYELWSEKELEAFGKKRNEMAFAALIIQSSYVGFYFMPVYSEPEKLKKVIHPDLLRILKGKSCFHVKRTDKNLLRHISEALAEGYSLYREKGWV
ncbi:MAG: DUF1801 domain-containing protein [Sphingobacteriales bacterium]|jgi:hypothetical protein|nr:DUF1801 domain-containing protein [Sphingobacteriales bacterium]